MAFQIITALVLAQGLTYPAAKKVDQVDDYNGVKVSDPYRWLEQPIETKEVRDWVNAEVKLTNSYFGKIKNRDVLLKELLHRVNYERYTTPEEESGVRVFTRNSGTQNQSVFYVMDRGSSKERLLLDPNKLSSKGTTAVNSSQMSGDGSKWLYGLSEGGSDWVTWHVRDIKTGKDLKDVIKWSKFGVGFFDRNANGVYYLHYPEPVAGSGLTAANENPEVRYHRLGSDSAGDKIILDLPSKPRWGIWPYMDGDRTTVAFQVENPESPNNQLWVLDAADPYAKIVQLFPANDANYTLIGRDNDTLYVQTTKNAPRGKIVKVSLTQPSKVETLVPESKDTIQTASFIGGRIVLNVMQDAHSAVRVYDKKGKLTRTVRLPGLGTADGFAGRTESRFTYYSYADFFTPATIYQLDVLSGMSTVWKRPKTIVDSNRYEAKQIFYRSKDGTRVPMYIVHKRGMKLDGHNPTMLYGYGGFNIPELPWFSTSRSVWMDMGGVFCLANIRGGGEYGAEWWQGAIKTKRQKAYDDFIAAGEWLIANKYTSKKYLAINGGSNGGLLVGACEVQRPDLFGVCVPQVGVMDLLRFNQFTIGRAWESDYGSPQNPSEFASIIKISPLQNIKDGVHYPPTLITTADRDDRVVPAHSFKFAARLQAAQGGTAPIILRVETTSGHGASNLTKSLEEVRDVYAFILHNMGIPIPSKF